MVFSAVMLLKMGLFGVFLFSKQSQAVPNLSNMTPKLSPTLPFYGVLKVRRHIKLKYFFYLDEFYFRISADTSKSEENYLRSMELQLGFTGPLGRN